MNTGSMSAKTACDVAVIGGGAAGMMAALQAAWAGGRVALLEKNEKLGKKIYITGKGRCNVTNVADIDDFFKQIPRNPRFLNAAARQFTHEDVTGLLEMLGTPTKVERGGRVFPESDKASDVTRALDRGMRDAGVTISLNTEVAHVRQADGGFNVELTQGGTLKAKSVIVATGGVSYPTTGSTGDGYQFARENGLNVTKLSASLVGMTMDEKWPMLLQGLSLKNVRITAKTGKKTIYSELGEMLFTHFGVSGPLIIELSSHMPEDFSRVNVNRCARFAVNRQKMVFNAVILQRPQHFFSVFAADKAVTGHRLTQLRADLCRVDTLPADIHLGLNLAIGSAGHIAVDIIGSVDCRIQTNRSNHSAFSFSQFLPEL
mgnify:CR=1 FL=1